MGCRLLPLCLIFWVATVHWLHAQPVDQGYLNQHLPAGQALTSHEIDHAEVFASDLLPHGLSASRASDVLQHVDEQPVLATRGGKEAQLFRTYAPSVVLIATDSALGSGSIISDQTILTSWHVVEGAAEVGILFKPSEEGRQFSPTDEVVVGHVVKFDQTSDLAIVELPGGTKPTKPLALAEPDEIEIGADVHAIGHPTGEAWTYTRGIISQFRKGYRWKIEGGVEHQADVVQTQTPINPGNSGGPLLSDKGHLIGVNAFKETGEGLNFAVSVNDVRKFLAAPTAIENIVQLGSKPNGCQTRVLYEGRDRDNESNIKLMDVGCTGKVNVALRIPDDQKRSIRLSIDHSGSGRADVWVYDWHRDGKWDHSLISSKHDEKIDLIGFHPDGKVTPSRYEPYHGQPTPWAN